MLLSVILVSYKNKEVLIDCLNSITQFNDLDNEVEFIVVEQSPTDEIYLLLKKKYSWVKTVKNENVGFGRGNNRGVEEATGEYLLFLNTDTILIEPIFQFAVHQFKYNAKLGAFGVQLLSKDKQKALSFALNQPFSKMSSIRTKIANDLGLFQEKKMYISGADIFIRNDIFKKIGGFDKNIFMYFEDTLLCNQVIQMGYDVCFYKQKRIIHLQGGSTSDSNVLTSKSFLSSYRYYNNLIGIDFKKVVERQIRRFKKESILFRLIDSNRSERLKKCVLQLEQYMREEL